MHILIMSEMDLASNKPLIDFLDINSAGLKMVKCPSQMANGDENIVGISRIRNNVHFKWQTIIDRMGSA